MIQLFTRQVASVLESGEMTNEIVAKILGKVLLIVQSVSLHSRSFLKVSASRSELRFELRS